MDDGKIKRKRRKKPNAWDLFAYRSAFYEMVSTLEI